MLTRVAYRHAKHAGVDVKPLVEQAGLTVETIEDQNTRLGVSNQIKFIALVADALDDNLLGFHMTQDIDFREIGLLYYVAASADALGSALRRVERYMNIQNEGVKLKVIKGKSVRVTFQYSSVARHTDIHQIVSFITLVIRVLRHITGRTLKPTTVRIIHHLGGDKSYLERLLNCTIEAGSRVDEVEFPATSWNLSVTTADPYLHGLCVRSCEDALVRRQSDASPLKVKVENTIAVLLPHGQAHQDLVAAELGVSPRTLARRLSCEDSSFAEILSDVRLALSRRYLADRALSISQIAWLLGYAEISTFTRAYQRWTGMPPSAARGHQQLSLGPLRA